MAEAVPGAFGFLLLAAPPLSELGDLLAEGNSARPRPSSGATRNDVSSRVAKMAKYAVIPARNTDAVNGTARETKVSTGATRSGFLELLPKFEIDARDVRQIDLFRVHQVCPEQERVRDIALIAYLGAIFRAARLTADLDAASAGLHRTEFKHDLLIEIEEVFEAD